MEKRGRTRIKRDTAKKAKRSHARAVSKARGTVLCKSGIEFLGEIPWGTHLCQFYETKEDLIDVLVPYLAEGLRNNEFCMWVTSPPLEAEEAEKALEKAVPDLQQYVENGQIEIISYKDRYLLGGTFDADRVLHGWVDKEKKALNRGFEGLRLTGNTFWIERKDWDRFADYEAKVNDVIGLHRMIAVCTYSLPKCSGSDVVDVIRNHVATMIRKGKSWYLVEDVALRKKLENGLAKTRNTMQEIMENAGVMLAYFDADFNFMAVNSAYAKGSGYSSEDLIGKNHFVLFPNAENQAAFEKVRNTGKPVTFFDKPFEFADQPERGVTYWDWTLSPVKDGRGQVQGLILALFETTERKKAEEQIRVLSRFPSENPNPVMRMSKDGVILHCNDAGSLILNEWTCQVGQLAPNSWREQVADVFKSGTKKEFEEEYGNRIFSFVLAPVTETGYVNVYGRDITERKKTEHALRESQIDLNRAQAVARTGSWRLNVRRNELLWSDETYRMFGIPKGTPMTYEAFLSFVHPDNREYVNQKWQAALRGEPYDIEHRIIVNGKVKWVRERAELELNDDGLLLGGFGTVQEITEVKEMQEKLQEYSQHLEKLVEERTSQLRDAERLATIGQTAGMVGHDIRNPLQSIEGAAYLAKEELKSLPAESEEKKNLQEIMEIIESQTNYIDHIVADLQDFARPPLPQPRETNIEEIIMASLSMIEIPENINFNTALEENAIKLTVDPVYLKRVLLNLIENSVQAMPNGGQLTLTAFNDTEHTCIDIADTGVGIPEEHKSKIFSPLFTTKAKGQGLGLAVCKKLVEAQEGEITFESQDGKGTTFKIKLPLAKKESRE